MATTPEIESHHYDPDDVIRSDEGRGADFYAVVESRLARRDVIKAGFFATVAAAASSALALNSKPQAGKPLGFTTLAPTKADGVNLPKNYRAKPLIRWGDPLKPGLPPFDSTKADGSTAADRFGYNCDYLAFMPLPLGSDNANRGLLAVNHEYTNPELMHPEDKPEQFSYEQIELHQKAVGMSVVEIRREGTEWSYIVDSRFNIRYTAQTFFEVTGPARGHAWMKTNRDIMGTRSMGTTANCSGGTTPWGTVLSGEENFQDYFADAEVETDPLKVKSHKRYGIPGKASEYGWERHDPRFSLKNEPNEPFHWGWVIEIDPYDPEWTPRKRTALGRFRHEAATTHVSKNDRLVLYSGCDGRFEYVYKFVADAPYNKSDRKANRDLLDKGTLYAAKFNEDGTGVWLPLVHGQNGLTAANGFLDQGHVVIDARLAADFLGATKMDRPEDIEVNPVNQKVYIVCTNNTDRGKEGRPGVDAMNPRPENRHGHIIELIYPEGDHTSLTFRWELFLVAGDPADQATHFAGFDKSMVSPISCPDNITFDRAGNLWIATDGAPRAWAADKNYKGEATHDGFYVCPTEGPERGHLRQFMSTVTGSEVCGPFFTADQKSLFLCIQHPGEGSKFSSPSTQWPDGKGQPRPSVVVITEVDGQPVGFGPKR